MLDMLICKKVKKRCPLNKNEKVTDEDYQYGSEDDEERADKGDHSDDYGNELPKNDDSDQHDEAETPALDEDSQKEEET